MKNINYFKLGLFVLVGMIMIMGSVFYLGFQDKFTDKVEFVTYFDQSVQGLTEGSSVKASGVNIGTVTNIGLVPSSDGLVKVTMETTNKILPPDKQLGMTKKQIDEHFRTYIKKTVDLISLESTYDSDQRSQAVSVRYFGLIFYNNKNSMGMLKQHIRKYNEYFCLLRSIFLPHCS